MRNPVVPLTCRSTGRLQFVAHRTRPSSPAHSGNAPARASRMRGASAVEFILTFPALLLCIYLLVVYSLVFLVQQTLTFAAAEGSRAAMITTTSTRQQLATSRVNDVLNALPAAIKSKIPAPSVQTDLEPSVCGNSQLRRVDGFSCVRVTINYAFASNPAIILLPGMEKMVPSMLSASASALYEN